jgi:hypothetical protein
MPVPAARPRVDPIPMSGVRRITRAILPGLDGYRAALAIAG